VNSIKISTTIFVVSVASTAVLAVALTLCVTVTITATLVIKKKTVSLKSLQRADSEKHQAAEIRPYEPTEPKTDHPKSDCVTLENVVYAIQPTTGSSQKL
jgi:mannitol-specific phosphotransferase system IIBC component